MHSIKFILSKYFLSKSNICCRKSINTNKIYQKPLYFLSNINKNVNTNPPLENNSSKVQSDFFPDNKEKKQKDIIEASSLDIPTSKYNKDYSYNPTIMKLNEDQKGYKSNTEIEIQLKDNPLAFKVLNEGQIDLKDKQVQMASLDVYDAAFLDSAEVEQIKQINLGTVSVIPKDNVLLEDLDVYNIPKDKDIMIDKKEKILIALGRKIEYGRHGLKVVKDEEIEEKKYLHSVGKNIFEEKTMEEFKKENLFFVEQDLLVFNYRELLRQLFRYLPFLILFTNLLGAFLELFTAKKNDFVIEEQEMRYLQNLRKQYANEILRTNPLFDRRNFLSTELPKESKLI